jgi:hypothetical protein
MDERKASLRISSFKHTVESLVAPGSEPKLPVLPHSEIDRLNFHSTGPAIVHEILRIQPIHNVGRIALSRYLSYVTAQQMDEMEVFNQLKEAWREYDNEVARHELRIREFYNSIIEDVCRSYKPFVARRDIHIWFWDDETKERVFSKLYDAQLPMNIFFALAARPLSEIGSVRDDRKSDLLAEYSRGFGYTDYVLFNLRWATENCRKLRGLPGK